MPGIETLYDKYQQRYPYYTREKIVDIMLDEGVINFEEADRLKKGVSIFYEQFARYVENKQQGIDATSIMGGVFNKSNFNREIEPTFQAESQGDCWLLSDINSLSYTEWGRKAIQDAIIPDNNGTGGVTIKFKGSPLSEKEIHITAKEIQEAKASGNYSSGDDDMIAFELATEKTFRKMVKLGLVERVQDDIFIQLGGATYRSFIYGGVTTNKYDQFPISQLLGIDTYTVEFKSIDIQLFKEKETDKILKWLADNKDNVSGTCSFSLILGGYGDKSSKDYLREAHAYAIKSLEYGKEVVVTDPYNSDYDIKVPWDDFARLVKDIEFSFKDTKTAQSLKRILPHNYEINIKKYHEEFDLIQIEDSMENPLADMNFLMEEMLKSEKLKRKEEKRIQKILKTIEQARKENNVELLKSGIYDRNTIMPIMEQYPDIVVWLCENSSRISKTKNIRCLVSPVIEALGKKAEQLRISNSIISDFKNRCYEEINAIFKSDT